MAKKATWGNLKAGDLFSIPVDEGQFYVGQIVFVPDKYSFYVEIFDCVCSSVEEINDAITTANIIFYGDTTDAEFYRESWVKFHNVSHNENFARPYHVVYTKPPPEGLVLRDFDRNYVRDATLGDLEYYGYKGSVSPTVFTTAVKTFINEGLNADYGSIDYRRVLNRCVLT